MKKYTLTIIFLFLYAYLFPIDIYINNYPRNIISNEKASFTIKLNNDENNTLYDLDISTHNDNDLEIILDKTRIEKIGPKETIEIKMDVTSKNKYYFNRNAYITIKVSKNEILYHNKYSFDIKPVKYFWSVISVSFVLLLSVLFIVIFIKISKGDGYAG